MYLFDVSHSTYTTYSKVSHISKKRKWFLQGLRDIKSLDITSLDISGDAMSGDEISGDVMSRDVMSGGVMYRDVMSFRV